ncbi:hypothetical protein MKK58_06190 [Methylobacterium sp. J-078]|uniref:hypothetical protein n=1 Tax=Methylobacterium sp. J-078 TaxID=2836657 RepID=UPI001FBA8E61|nr:hypothetical protein [Methylobacterium sp. J-078]MCJ2044122.1 hypothetical protein [Methylobacterium sp. J-078]
MARYVETCFVRHADAVRSSEHDTPGEIRLDVFDPPTGWLGRPAVRDILLRARLERPCAWSVAYVDLRGARDPWDDVIDLRRL